LKTLQFLNLTSSLYSSKTRLRL